MFCPNDECPDYLATGLRSEYRPEVTVCPYCGTPLSGDRPAVGGSDADHPVTNVAGGGPDEYEVVLETTDLTEIAVVRSALEAAGIPFVTEGEARFGAFRGSFFGSSMFNPRSGGVIFAVPGEMAADARAVLEANEDVASDPVDP